MKVRKYAGNWKGQHGSIKTSGGGNFEGMIGRYDEESNTIDVWNGLKRTRVDADKIVSVNSTSPLAAILFIALFVGFCFLLLHITEPSSRYDHYDRYDRYERHYR
jgi:hypothetical protein